MIILGTKYMFSEADILKAGVSQSNIHYIRDRFQKPEDIIKCPVSPRCTIF